MLTDTRGNPINNNHQKINCFFKEFKNESLIWTTYLWVKKQNVSHREYLDLLNERHSFESLASYLKKKFEQENAEELSVFIQHCQNKKIQYAPNEDLVFLSKNPRLCWLCLNNLERENEIRKNTYNYRNPYFSLLFLIHIIINNKFRINILNKYIKSINSEKNPLKLLKSYIDDDNFIEWALSYTESKHRIRTYPSFESKDNEQKRDKFLGFWDDFHFNSPDKYELEINKLKKAWQQKQFRDNGGTKKQYHLPLTKNTKSQLADLAAKLNISEYKVLEKLIEDAYKNEMLDASGKKAY